MLAHPQRICASTRRGPDLERRALLLSIRLHNVNLKRVVSCVQVIIQWLADTLDIGDHFDVHGSTVRGIPPANTLPPMPAARPGT